jgi:hypothetical protein
MLVFLKIRILLCGSFSRKFSGKEVKKKGYVVLDLEGNRRAADFPAYALRRRIIR